MNTEQEDRAEATREVLGIDALDDAANGLLADFLLANCNDVELLRKVLNDEDVPDFVVVARSDLGL